MQDTLIDQGINLMLFGMGTVFVFLTILVFATTLMSKIVNRFAPEAEPLVTPDQAPASPVSSQTISPQVVDAIQKAIAAHRQK